MINVGLRADVLTRLDSIQHEINLVR